MEQLPVTLPRILSVWWLIIWRGLLGAIILGVLIGFVVGFIWAIAGLPPGPLKPVTTAIGLIVGISMHIVATGMALRKTYQGFRIILVRA